MQINDQHVKSFLEYVDWESFVINEIYRILDKTADISIYINSEQKSLSINIAMRQSKNKFEYSCAL